MKAEAFIVVGRDIAGGLPTAEKEASHRSACGRAYYAAFGTAREWLAEGGFEFVGNDEDHGRVVHLLKLSKDKAVQTAGSQLGQLRKTRNSSDYDTGNAPVRRGPFDVVKALSALGTGERVISEVKRAALKDRRLFIPLGVS